MIHVHTGTYQYVQCCTNTSVFIQVVGISDVGKMYNVVCLGKCKYGIVGLYGHVVYDVVAGGACRI